MKKALKYAAIGGVVAGAAFGLNKCMGGDTKSDSESLRLKLTGNSVSGSGGTPTYSTTATSTIVDLPGNTNSESSDSCVPNQNQQGLDCLKLLPVG